MNITLDYIMKKYFFIRSRVKSVNNQLPLPPKMQQGFVAKSLI